MPTPRRRFLIVSQVYVPDPAAVGQHLHEVAAALAAWGHDVRVVASRRGYDDPTREYPEHELIDGVRVRRYGLPVFSKSNMLLRVFGSAWAMMAIFGLGLFGGRTDVIVFSTSPPMVGVLGVVLSWLKRARTIYWAMDLNPDQLIRMGKLRETAMVTRLIESANRFVLRRASLTVTLDRFMAGRLQSAPRRPNRVEIIAPWAPAPADRPVRHEQNPFRHRHGLDGKFVVMYSGNHTPANPIDTVLNAAVAMKDDDRVRFAFIGGGLEKQKVRDAVQQHGLTNVLDLPYQPMSELPYSLSAADVHVVTLGESMVGVVHPCKVYGAMAVGRPILFVGPRPSHVTDMLDASDIGRAVSHGDVARCVAVIRELAALPVDRLDGMGQRAAAYVGGHFDHATLVTHFCEQAERV